MKNKIKTIDEYCNRKPETFQKFVKDNPDPDKMILESKLKKTKEGLKLTGKKFQSVEELEAHYSPQILQNAIAILENYPNITYLVSSHVHDLKEYVFKDKTTIFVDGGHDYLRRGGSALGENGLGGYANKWMEFSLNEKVPFNYLKDRLLWGTRGKDGKQKLKYVLLKDCETEHLKAILTYSSPTGKSIKGTIYEKVIKNILKERI